MRLLDYYLKLSRAFPQHDGPIRLDDVMASLHCSPRHARHLLQQMKQNGWLAWQPGRGRGHCSQLRLIADPDALEYADVHRLLAEGELEKAVQTLSPQGRRQLSQWLPGYLGIVPQAARTLRLPFYRPLHGLDPTQTSRRTECHLCRHLFDGLTRFDGHSGRVVPALAHHWSANAAQTRWRFHLRAGVQFHHGRPLESADVVSSLLALRDRPGLHQGLLAHLADIEVIEPLTLDLQLKSGDCLLPHRLADIAAAILPADCRDKPDFDQFPVGTGPFMLTANNPYRVTLRAFDRYWHVRPLLDAVDIWIVDDPQIMVTLDARFFHAEDPPQPATPRLLEAGCSYLATNPARLTRRAQRQLAALLHPERWQPDISGMPAWALLPEWRPALPAPAATAAALPKQLHLVTYQNPNLIELAQAVAARLAQAGSRLTIEVLPYPAFSQRAWLDRADLMLCGEVLEDDLDFAMYKWLFQAPGYQPWLAQSCRDAMRTAAGELAAEPDAQRRWQAYERIAQQLVASLALIPLRHHTQQMVLSPRVQGGNLTQCGWMDFAKVWLAPAAAD